VVDRPTPLLVALGRGTLAPMDLEEHSLEQIGDRCEECGAKLTRAEIEAALESGGPALCTVHADEVVPVGDEDDAFSEEYPSARGTCGSVAHRQHDVPEFAAGGEPVICGDGFLERVGRGHEHPRGARRQHR
jgi:hypothetical protein